MREPKDRAVMLGFWVGLICWSVAMAGATLLVVELLDADFNPTTPVFPVGVLLAALLVVPLRHWPWYGAALAAVALLVLGFGGLSWPSAIWATVAFVLPAYVAALFLRHDTAWIAGADRLRSWLRFLVFGVVVAPLSSVGMAVVWYELRHPSVGWDTVESAAQAWYLASGVAVWVVVPVVLRVRALDWTRVRPPTVSEVQAGVATVGGLAAVAFSFPTSLTAIYLLTLGLVLLIFRLGSFGLVAAIALTSAVVITANTYDVGAFVVLSDHNQASAVSMYLTYFLLCFAILVLVMALLAERANISPIGQLSDEVHRLIARTTGDAVFLADLDGRIVYISDQVTPDQRRRLLGEEWMNAVHPDDVPNVRTGFAQLRAGDGIAEYVVRVALDGGSPRWFHCRLSGPHSTSTHDGLVVAVARDVTEGMTQLVATKQVNERLYELALTDPLTGIANRRHLEEKVDVLWHAARSAHGRFSVLLLDIDSFKAYNDAYGHAAGDECLCAIAEILTRVAEENDGFGARYGGDELVMLIPRAGQRQAYEAAHRIRNLVHQTDIAHGGSTFGRITVSIGTATVNRADRASDVTAVFEAADAAMYIAKHRGGDAVSDYPVEGHRSPHGRRPTRRHRVSGRGSHSLGS